MAKNKPEKFNVEGKVKATLIIFCFWAFFVLWYAIDYDGFMNKNKAVFGLAFIYLGPIFLAYQIVRIRKNTRQNDRRIDDN